MQDLAEKSQAAGKQGQLDSMPEDQAEAKESGFLEADMFQEAKILLWDAIRLFHGYWFGDRRRMECCYTVCGEGLHFSGRGTVTKEAVDAVFRAALVLLGRGGRPGAADFLEHIKCRDICGIGVPAGSEPEEQYPECSCLGCQECLCQVFERFGILGKGIKNLP